MPDLSATEGSDILVRRWLVAEGARVKRGQPLLEVETDKATTEVESLATGVVTEILARSDVKVAVGQVIARIEVEA
jgi:pyruvate/2-oxoglutarate dehydrogenase complex dihydrolipoamide acyltransferase (E2) component